MRSEGNGKERKEKVDGEIISKEKVEKMLEKKSVNWRKRKKVKMFKERKCKLKKW